MHDLRRAHYLFNLGPIQYDLIGIPILGINPVSFWYALRESGFRGAFVTRILTIVWRAGTARRQRYANLQLKVISTSPPQHIIKISGLRHASLQTLRSYSALTSFTSILKTPDCWSEMSRPMHCTSTNRRIGAATARPRKLAAKSAGSKRRICHARDERNAA